MSRIDFESLALGEHLNFWRGQSREARGGRAVTSGRFARRFPSTSMPHLPVASKTGPTGESGPDIVCRWIPSHHCPKVLRALWRLYSRAGFDCSAGNSVRLGPLLVGNSLVG